MTTTQATIDTIKILNKVTDDMLNRGYYMTPNWSEVGLTPIIPEYSLRNLARAIAKENKRPFIRISHVYRWHYVGEGRGTTGWQSSYNKEYVGLRVLMPRRKYLSPLAHPLLLARFEQVYPSMWGFVINDETFAKQYLEYFDTREEFRAALKLPPKVSNITPLQEAA